MLNKEEAVAIRNIAFLIAVGKHKLEWYLEEIKICIRPDSLDHALAYLNFLTSDGKLIFNRRSYGEYVKSLKKNGTYILKKLED